MIYLMRHGQDDERFIGGWSDVELIEDGKVQVYDSASWLKENLNIKKVICSDVKRAIQTSQIVKDVINVNYQPTKDLREQSKGLLNGTKLTVAKEMYPEYFNNVNVDTIYPNGESLRDLYNRVKDKLDFYMQMDADTLLITHRGVINMLYYILNDLDLDMNKKRFNVDYASIHELDTDIQKIRRIR